VVPRGDCNFSTKIQHAQAAGAAAIIVANTEASMYNDTSGELLDPCSLNCDVSSSTSLDECNAHCPGSTCAANGNSADFCCVQDALVDMYLEDQFDIPAYFARQHDSSALFLHAAKSANVAVEPRAYATWDLSIFFLFFWANLVLAGSSWFAVDRSLKITRATAPIQEEELSLSVQGSFVFLLSSSVALVGLFFLVQRFPHLVVVSIQILFTFSTFTALGEICKRAFPEVSGGVIFCCVLCIFVWKLRMMQF
jgi:hypothetical protein